MGHLEKLMQLLESHRAAGVVSIQQNEPALLGFKDHDLADLFDLVVDLACVEQRQAA